MQRMYDGGNRVFHGSLETSEAAQMKRTEVFQLSLECKGQRSDISEEVDRHCTAREHASRCSGKPRKLLTKHALPNPDLAVYDAGLVAREARLDSEQVLAPVDNVCIGG
mmetsp:Transcript_34080/g.90851  ORF Transcript_34080/g.90851 Transcript_34080/m.90851 type:complete len:109 (+) Transcript_34080:737-1063(+)